MSDATIVSRLIVGARCSPELEERLRDGHPGTDQVGFCVFEVTATRGARQRRVLACWSGGSVDPGRGPRFTPIGHGALEALMSLPVCMDEHPAAAPVPVICELRLGRTPLREKVIERVLTAPPGARLCFLGDLAGELDGQMSPTFNIIEGEPILLDDDMRPV